MKVPATRSRDKPVEIVSRRLKLRPPTHGDAATIAELAQDWEIVSMTSRMPWPYTIDDARTWVEDEGETTFAITFAGHLIGITGYMPDGHGSAEIGYWLDRGHWGQGFATEAAGALIRHAFRTDGFAKLTCGHFHDNPASARVIAKLGFERVGEANCWCEARAREVPAIRYELVRPRGFELFGRTFGWRPSKRGAADGQ